MRPSPKQQSPHHFIRRWPSARRQERDDNRKPFEVKKLISLLQLPFYFGPKPLDIDSLAEKAKAECPAGYILHGAGDIFQTIQGLQFYSTVEVTYRKAPRGKSETIQR